MSYREKNGASQEFSNGLALDVATILKYRSKGIALHDKQIEILEQRKNQYQPRDYFEAAQ